MLAAAALGPIIGRLGAYVMILIVAWFWWEEQKAAWILIGKQEVTIATEAVTNEFELKIRDNQQAFEKELAQVTANALAELEDSRNENDLQRDINQRLAQENPFEFALDFTNDLSASMQQIEDAYSTSSISANVSPQGTSNNAEEFVEESDAQ